MDNDKYITIMARDGFICQECGATPGVAGLQLAHRIKKGKGSEKHIRSFFVRFGIGLDKAKIREVLSHPDNLVTVCSLKCNDKQNIFYKTVERDELLWKIFRQIMEAGR